MTPAKHIKGTTVAAVRMRIATPAKVAKKGIPSDHDQEWSRKAHTASRVKKNRKHGAKFEECVNAYDSEEVAASTSKHDMRSRLRARKAGAPESSSQLQACADAANIGDNSSSSSSDESLTVRIPGGQRRKEKPLRSADYKRKWGCTPPLSYSAQRRHPLHIKRMLDEAHGQVLEPRRLALRKCSEAAPAHA